MDALTILENNSFPVSNLTFQSTTDKDYARLKSFWNITSYSMMEVFHACPRKFFLSKQAALVGSEVSHNNVHFAFGHAVGSGIQSWLVSKDTDTALLNSFLAWRIPYALALEKKKKSIWEANLAVLRFPAFFESNLEDWEIFTLPEINKPAIELAVEIDFENGFKHYVHIDAILRNKYNGKLAVLENKTSSKLEEAIYANSSQALSYAAVIDAISDDTSYEVFYCVYDTSTRDWNLLPFTKSVSLKAEWLLDIRLDHAAISTYKELNFFPKRGESCYDYMSRCQFFGECNLLSQTKELNTLGKDESAEVVDIKISVSQMIAKQQERMNENEID